MTRAESEPRFLEIFPQWLRSLGSDVTDMADALGADASGDDASRWLVGGIHYVFKSLDLIPDGIDDLGFLDDAFVVRVACALAAAARSEPLPAAVQRLAEDAAAVRDFLGEDYARLEGYVRALRGGAARGRSVDEVLGDPGVRERFLDDVRRWAAEYRPPSFTRDAKTLVKLKAFLSTKLA